MNHTFEEYLVQLGFKAGTVYQHQKNMGYFSGFLTGESLSLEQVGHSEILDFVDAFSKEGRDAKGVNRILVSVQYYFSWLKEEKKNAHNPAIGIRLKGTVRNIPHGLLERAELEALYDGYGIKDDRTHRNKVMLGLLVYQGLSGKELEMLRREHLKLREGKIQVPQTGRNNGRTLALQPHQVLALQEYLLVIRSRIQHQTERLFTGRNDTESLKNSLVHLNRALRKINPMLKNAGQIRQSVITEWLKEKDLRIVQYMAGHRYVSSTERYQSTNLQDLKEALNKYHPLK
jgi:integrase/recombinase XerD